LLAAACRDGASQTCHRHTQTQVVRRQTPAGTEILHNYNMPYNMRQQFHALGTTLVRYSSPSLACKPDLGIRYFSYPAYVARVAIHNAWALPSTRDSLLPELCNGASRNDDLRFNPRTYRHHIRNARISGRAYLYIHKRKYNALLGPMQWNGLDGLPRNANTLYIRV